MYVLHMYISYMWVDSLCIYICMYIAIMFHSQKTLKQIGIYLETNKLSTIFVNMVPEQQMHGVLAKAMLEIAYFIITYFLL